MIAGETLYALMCLGTGAAAILGSDHRAWHIFGLCALGCAAISLWWPR